MVSELVLPAVNYFGSGSINKLTEIAHKEEFKNVLIVSDKNLEKLGYVKKIVEILSAVGVKSQVYAETEPNPTIKNVEEGFQLQKSKKCDGIIGLGGGSANDCAKAITIMSSNNGNILDYVGVNKSSKKLFPLIAINTTAGTASEISRAFIISNNENQEKLIFKDINALPDYSINDIDLMINLPSNVTAQTGMDALTHAIEAYVSTGTNKMTKIFSKEAVSLIFEYLEEVVTNPHYIDGREGMIHAEFLAGMAFCNSGVGLAHAISHALGAIYNLPHGLCNAVVLPEVIQYNSTDPNVLSEYKTLAVNTIKNEEPSSNAETVQKFIDSIKDLNKSIGINQNLSYYGVKKEDFDLIAEKTINDGNYPRNPIAPSKEDIKKLLEKIY